MNIFLIIDESGSMGPLRSETVSGFNKFLAEQQAIGKAEVAGKRVKPARLHVTKFDSQGIRKPIWDKPIEDVKPWTEADYTPGASTPLLDAVGDTLTEAKGKQALVVIITDGLENASSRWTKPKVKELIEKKQADGWTVLFFGANIDAFAEAHGLGVRGAGTSGFAFNAIGLGSSYGTMSDTAMLARSGMGSGSSIGNAGGATFLNATQAQVDYLNAARAATGSSPTNATVVDPTTAASSTVTKPKAKK